MTPDGGWGELTPFVMRLRGIDNIWDPDGVKEDGDGSVYLNINRILNPSAQSVVTFKDGGVSYFRLRFDPPRRGMSDGEMNRFTDEFEGNFPQSDRFDVFYGDFRIPHVESDKYDEPIDQAEVARVISSTKKAHGETLENYRVESEWW